MSAGKGEARERRADPLRLHNAAGDWYLVAWDLDRAAARTFALSRIHDLQRDGSRRPPPPGFDLSAYLREHFAGMRGEERIAAVVRIEPPPARWVREKRWPGETGREERADGALILHLEVTHAEGLLRWALSLGAAAEILAPPALRRQMAEETRRLAGRYAGAGHTHVDGTNDAPEEGVDESQPG